MKPNDDFRAPATDDAKRRSQPDPLAVDVPPEEKSGIHERVELSTILLVDDDPLLRRIGVRILHKAGYQVLTAPNGAAALERGFDGLALLITDLHMSDVDGLSLIAQMRARHPEMPAVLVSGQHGDAELSARLATLRAGLLAKPFGAAQLLEAVRTACGPAAPRSEAAVS